MLVIDDGSVRLESADDVRGAACADAEGALRARLGADYRIASIGPAGERAVRYATISHDGRHAGRGGSGAVLGSKNIKAMAVRGTQRTDWAHQRRAGRAEPRPVEALVRPGHGEVPRAGHGDEPPHVQPLRHAADAQFPERHVRGGGAAVARAAGRRARAARAPAASPARSAASTSTASGRAGVRLEYESLFALGSLCGVGDGDAVLRAAKRCDELGIDTISTGATIAFAMECAERGLLDEPWLRFGSGDAMLRGDRPDRPPRGRRRAAGRGQPPCGADDRAAAASRSRRK